MQQRVRRLMALSRLETLIVVSLVASVFAIMVPQFFANLRTNKLDEPVEHLNELFELVREHYEDRGKRCLPAEAGPTPFALTDVLRTVDFYEAKHMGAPTWETLQFNPSSKIRFQYSYQPSHVGCQLKVSSGSVLFKVLAEGDLDGDGKKSRYERLATLNEDGMVVPLWCINRAACNGITSGLSNFRQSLALRHALLFCLK